MGVLAKSSIEMEGSSLPRPRPTSVYQPTLSGKPRAIDLFCGCGGLTTGLKMAGFRVVGAVDVDPFALATFRANHRGVRLWERDIRSVSTHEVMTELNIEPGKLDLLAGCPPCQGFSSIRTRNRGPSVDDERNDLLYEFQRFVEELRPRAVMIENVPSLAKDERFEKFCQKLIELGYKGDFKILNAADFGVPQRRNRLIYLAGHGVSIPFAEKSRKQLTVRMAIEHLPPPGASGDPAHDILEQRSPRIMRLIRSIPKNGGSRSSLPPSLQLDCHKNFEGFRDVYGRMTWDDVAPTITGGCLSPSKGRFLHPDQDRAITAREAALLQGFPKGYKFPITNNKTALAGMIGNALPPPFVAAHAKSVRRILGALNRSDYVGEL